MMNLPSSRNTVNKIIECKNIKFLLILFLLTKCGSLRIDCKNVHFYRFSVRQINFKRTSNYKYCCYCINKLYLIHSSWYKNFDFFLIKYFYFSRFKSKKNMARKKYENEFQEITLDDSTHVKIDFF